MTFLIEAIRGTSMILEYLGEENIHHIHQIRIESNYFLFSLMFCSRLFENSYKYTWNVFFGVLKPVTILSFISYYMRSSFWEKPSKSTERTV